MGFLEVPIIRKTRGAFRKKVKKSCPNPKKNCIFTCQPIQLDINNFLANVEKIFETLKQFETNLNLKHQVRKPKMSDLELIAVDLTGIYEY